WPEKLSPQHLTPPLLVRAQVWSHPAAMAATPLCSPTTPTDVRRLAFVPSPNWPSALSPQHLTPPAVVRAQVWRFPAVMALMPLCSPTTPTDVSRLTFVPSPTWPPSLSPQHLTPPSVVIAQVWNPPAVMALTPLSSPSTSTG